MTERLPWSDPAADPLTDVQDVARLAPGLPVACRHCGQTSHGFVCCGLLFADEPGGCPCNHDLEAAKPPHRAPVKGQSGPPKPFRAPRRLDPRGSR